MTNEKLYWIVTYSSDTWADGDSHCIVLAKDEDEAFDIAQPYCDEVMLEMFRDEDEEAAHESGVDVEYSGASISGIELYEGVLWPEYLDKVNF